MTLPIVYSDDFYERVMNYSRYSQLGFYKDLLISSISCRYEKQEEETVIYIMSISVLKPYRRYGIGTQLLNKAIEDCKKDGINKIYLHVLQSNGSAIEFYKKAGFSIVETLNDYYKDLDDPHCYKLQMDLTGWEKQPDGQDDEKK